MIIRIMDKSVSIRSPEPLTSILRQLNIHLPLYCGGNGSCGKCLVRVYDGTLPITSFDRQCLTEEQLEQGYRLGCKAVVTGSCSIEVAANSENDFFIPSSVISGISVETGNEKKQGRNLGISVDIGTTTISMVLVDIDSGHILREYAGLNHQRSYGTDVMARIKAFMDGKGPELQRIIRKDLEDGFLQLVKEIRDSVDIIVIAGNTTMMHLLRGYDCSGLGGYPFTPCSLGFEKMTLEELLGISIPALACTEVILMPGVSAFIGSDITAGLWGSGIWKTANPCVFLDIGTNAEMAVGCNGHILASSAAAGPAFEGGQLSCGTGSIPGAIKDIKIRHGLVRYETIGHRSPLGICGTGIVSGISELLENKIMDSNGVLLPRYASGGFQVVSGKIGITQADIREFQKAKAAIRAGLDILIASADYKIEEIAALKLAGGFGCQLDIDKAVIVGLIPEELADKVQPLGNAVITGLIMYMREPDENGVEQMIEEIKEFSLSNHPKFIQKFLAFFCF